MSQECSWLHSNLLSIPLVTFPFKLSALPKNGIYFFYELGELQTYNTNDTRIVRIGTHKSNNFRSRISDHYLFDDKEMDFHIDKRKPSDRSIFRKNIGRVLLHKDNESYRCIWDKNFTATNTRNEWGIFRDIEKEQELECQITEIIRSKFSFRFIIIEDESRRLGKDGLEKRLIGTVAKCRDCDPSPNWLGKDSPVKKVRESGLWQYQHLTNDSIDETDKKDIEIAIEKTIAWVAQIESMHI